MYMLTKKISFNICIEEKFENLKDTMKSQIEVDYIYEYKDERTLNYSNININIGISAFIF